MINANKLASWNNYSTCVRKFLEKLSVVTNKEILTLILAEFRIGQLQLLLQTVASLNVNVT